MLGEFIFVEIFLYALGNVLWDGVTRRFRPKRSH